MNKTQQQTISLLVSEKAALAAQVEHLQGEESRKYYCYEFESLLRKFIGREEAEELLKEERDRRAFIASKFQEAEAKLADLTSQLKHSQAREQESSRKLQEQVSSYLTKKIATIIYI